MYSIRCKLRGVSKQCKHAAGTLFGGGVFLLLLAGCGQEPLRDNPADPGSSLYDPAGTLTLSVRNRNGAGLANAEILFLETAVAAYTNTLGNAELTLPPGTHSFTISLPGYVALEQNATVPFRGSLSRAFTLNGMPSIESVHFITTMYQEEEPESARFIFGYRVEARAADVDGQGDIERVELLEPDATSPILLDQFSPGSGWYAVDRELGYDVGLISDLVNQPMTLAVHDDADALSEQQASIASFFYYKLIWEDMIKPGPDSAENPTFEWLNARRSPDRNQIWFNEARYRLEVFPGNAVVPDIDTTVTFETALLDTFRLTLTEGLTPGLDYRWRITMFDPFGNLVRSRKSLFRPI